MSLILQAVFGGLCVAGILAGIRYSENKQSFFSSEEVVDIRGWAAIIVFASHFPQNYSSLLLRFMGLFAASAVTFFFLTSAYGLSIGTANKTGYIQHFWSNRLVSILVPTITGKLFYNGVNLLTDVHPPLLDNTDRSVLMISSWVRVLLVLYFIYWFVHYLREKATAQGSRCGFLNYRIRGVLVADYVICAVIVVLSLITRLTPCKIFLTWSFQSLGFVYGIIFYYSYPWLKEKISAKWIGWMFSACTGILIFGFAYYIIHIPFLSDYVIHLMFHFCCVLLLLVLNRRIKIGNKISKYLGRISFEIFLIHNSVYQMVLYFLPKLNAGAFLWVSLVLTVLFAGALNAVNSMLISWMREKQRRKNYL